MSENFFEKIILGEVGIVKTIGILTAENPAGRKLVKDGNEKKNKELEEELNKLGIMPIQLKGKFAGKSENPFLVINISRQKLVEFGKKYRQEAVIFGEKKTKLGGKIAPLFEFSYIVNGRTIRKGILGIEHPQTLVDRDSYFSLGGKKFNIHFNR